MSVTWGPDEGYPEHRELFPRQDVGPDPGNGREQDDAREHDWNAAMSEIVDFAKKYGVSATLRMVGAALEGQLPLFK